MKQRTWIVLAALAVSSCSGGATDEAQETAPSEPVAIERGVVRLDHDTRVRLDVRSSDLVETSEAPTVLAYGTLELDPSRTSELRVPLAGVVRADEAAWPTLGAALADNARVGTLEPRLSAAERVDLAARVESAKGDATSARAALDAANKNLERARTLNANDKNVSDRELEQARAAVNAEAARLEAALALQRVAEEALRGGADASSNVPLDVTHGGEVIELLARPGEALEAGAAILRVARFDQLLARIELPLQLASEVQALEIEPLGRAGERKSATIVGRAALASGAPALLARVACGDTQLRPGEAVTAYLRLAGTPASGAIVPRDCVVRFEGRAWVYVESEAGVYTRHEIALDRPRPDGWFVEAPWTRGARVVSRGAQSLLSCEVLGGAAEEEE